MAKSLTIANTKEVSKNVEVEKAQNKFLDSTLWKIINTGLNTGIRAVLPNFVEDIVIDVKDAIINNGFKSGAKQAIQSAKNIGKSAVGIVTGEFDNVSQAYTAVKEGGIIDGVGQAFNYAISAIEKKGIVDKNVASMLKNGSEVILSTIEANIEENFSEQLNAIEKLSKYNKQWKEYFENKDFNGMEKEYKKMKTELKKIMPTENTIKETRKIENIHTLIKNNGKSFELSEEALALAGELT